MINKVILILFFNLSNPDSSMMVVQNFTSEYKFFVLDTSSTFDSGFIVIESDVKYAHNFRTNNRIKILSYLKKDSLIVSPFSTNYFYVKVRSFKRNDWHDMIYYTGMYKASEKPFVRNSICHNPIKGPIYVLAKKTISFIGLRTFLDNNSFSFKEEK